MTQPPNTQTPPNLPFEQEADVALQRQEILRFRNGLQGLSGTIGTDLSAASRRDLTTHDSRFRTAERYLAVRTLYHLTDHILTHYPENPADPFIALWAAADDTHPAQRLTPLAHQVIGHAYQLAKRDLAQHEAAPSLLTRRRFLAQGAAAAGAGMGFFGAKTAYDINRHERAPTTTPSPDEQVPTNVALTGIAGKAGWHAGALAFDAMPDLSPLWQSLQRSLRLQDSTLTTLLEGIHIASQAADRSQRSR